VGVVLPTRNCAPLLSEHLESMAAWLDLIDEVVVVDSESTDGTRQLIRERLRHPSVRWLDHPPGLYQCWNHGIQNLHTDYIYVSTVGDGIAREGLLHLREVADRFDADLVISAPDFLDESGCPTVEPLWPVRRLIELMDFQEPGCLQGWPVFLFAIAFCPDALLGSSASNLYRASFLQAHPFPTEYGMLGDGAWGVMNALSLRLGVTPKRFSHFRSHAKSYSPREYVVAEDPKGKLLRAAKDILADARIRSPEAHAEAERLSLPRLVDAAVQGQHWRVRLDKERERSWPWSLNPLAWRARHSRNACEREVGEHLASAFRELRRQGLPSPAPRPGETESGL